MNTIEVGPFSIFFTNVNTEMKLPGHSHFALVKLTYLTTGQMGFPSFRDTHQEIHEKLREVTARPFRNSTNEDVLQKIIESLFEFKPESAKRYDTEKSGYELISVVLQVRGVFDHIGHADSFTTYRWKQE